MEFVDALEFFARFVWPLLLAWNIYLFKQNQGTRDHLLKFQLHVAENYIAKADLEKMMGGFEKRFDKRFDQLFQLINK